uniref:Uncharacterized protein MANES_12G084500 n=1 Tax=Rhizophora mucronata TaxID=61149 RepID=A0A2P2JQH8_RHIMU
MKPFLVSPNSLRAQQWREGHGIFRDLLKALLFSTDAAAAAASSSSFSSSSPPPIDSLRSRILSAGDPNSSVVSVLEEWLDQGNRVNQSGLQLIIKLLRKSRRYTHALQLSDWMIDQKAYNPSTGDFAVQLDLILRIHGIEHTEKYFNRIPESLRTFQIYGPLLHSCAGHRGLEKAEATMQKIRDLGFLKGPVSYNIMLKLCSQMRKYEELSSVVQEMEEKCIGWDTITYNNRLHAYAATSNVEKMEKLLMKIEADRSFSMDWHAYAVVAHCYLKGGLIEKAQSMLKKSEQLMRGKSGKPAKIGCEHLLSLYAAVGKKDEVYRIWNWYKSLGRFFNSSYLSMMSALVKLDDLTGAEKIWKEWESGRSSFDIRIPNLMISAYSRKGLWPKAEEHLNKIIESGMEPQATTWDRLATGYYLGDQMEKAVQTIKKAIFSSKKPQWTNVNTLAACLEYLRRKGNVEVAEELSKVVIEHFSFSPSIRNKLMGCSSKGDLSTGAVDQKGADDHSLGEEAPPELEFKDQSST